MKRLIPFFIFTIMLTSCGGGGSSSGGNQANRCTFTLSGSTVSTDIAPNALDFVRKECKEATTAGTRMIRECGINLKPSHIPQETHWNGEKYEIALQGATNLVDKGELARAFRDISAIKWLEDNPGGSTYCPIF